MQYDLLMMIYRPHHLSDAVCRCSREAHVRIDVTSVFAQQDAQETLVCMIHKV